MDGDIVGRSLGLLDGLRVGVLLVGAFVGELFGLLDGR